MAKPSVKMNKVGQHTINVQPQAVSVWLKNGWTLVEDGSSEVSETPVRELGMKKPDEPVTTVVAPDKTKE